MAMSDDIAWFEQNRPAIARTYPGQYVIVKNRSVIGAYPDYASAYNAGAAMFGTEPFVVKEAVPTQEIETMTALNGRRRGHPLPYLGQTYNQAVERLRQDGALVNVQIQVPEALVKQLKAAGRPVPPPQVVRGMVDTGASISTVNDAVAAAAGLQQVGSVPLGGVGGMSTRPIFSAYFGLPEYGVAVDPIEIAGVTIPAHGFDVLVGRDVLRALHLDYAGPRGTFGLTQEEGSLPPASGGGVVANSLPKSPNLGTPLAIGIGGAAIVGLLFALDVF